MQRTDSFEKTLSWERLKAGGEGDNRGWVHWMASPTQWTRVWVNSESWWWTGMPGVLWSTGLWRVGRDWETELNSVFLLYLPSIVHKWMNEWMNDWVIECWWLYTASSSKENKSHQVTPCCQQTLASSLHLKGRAPILDVRVPSSRTGSATDSVWLWTIKISFEIEREGWYLSWGHQLISLYDILFHRYMGVMSRIIKAN